MPLGLKMARPLGSYDILLIKYNNLKNISNNKAHMCCIGNVMAACGTQPTVFKLFPWDLNWPHLDVTFLTCIYIVQT